MPRRQISGDDPHSKFRQSNIIIRRAYDLKGASIECGLVELWHGQHAVDQPKFSPSQRAAGTILDTFKVIAELRPLNCILLHTSR